MKSKTALIFLAGGTGSRMATTIPKQFLMLAGRPIFSYSFEVFAAIEAIDTIIVVCSEEYRHYFDTYKNITFAQPGERRQDSVHNGFKKVPHDTSFIIIHDAARPFISTEMTLNVLSSAEEHGAATVGLPVVYTVKRANTDNFVTETLPREYIWEIQTPQTLSYEIMQKGFEYASSKNITVTDDVSFAEIQGLPVKLVMGSRNNIKITTVEDLHLAETILNRCE